MMASHYYTSCVVRAGGHHVAHAGNGQDHATTRVCDGAVVLAVADGVSGRHGFIGGRRSRTEVGAWLCAEIAASAAHKVLERGCDGPPGAYLPPVHMAVCEALAAGLGPLSKSIGPIFDTALPSTLLLAVATPRACSVWLSGDGAWGAVLAPGHRPDVYLHTDPEHDTLTIEDGLSLRGGRHLKTVDSSLASLASRRGPEAVSRGLELVFHANHPPLALWVATDGLEDEPRLRERLQRPVRDIDAIHVALSYPAPRHVQQLEPGEHPPAHAALRLALGGANHDDLGVAFTAVRHEGLVSAVLREVAHG